MMFSSYSTRVKFFSLFLSFFFSIFSLFPSSVFAAEINSASPEFNQLVRHNAAERIINGVDADTGEFPWVVSIGVNTGNLDNPFENHFCGGSLIDEQWVLTAAHCVVTSGSDVVAPSSLRLTFGDNDLTDISELDTVEVERIITHPNYSGRATEGNDIALLELSEKVSSPTAQLVSASTPEDDDAVLSTVIGWGTTEEGGLSPLLQKVDVPIVSNAVCNQPESYNGQIIDSMVCAGYRQGGRDSCQGDSGGPLISDRTKELTGIVSWGAGCAVANKYGVYTRVADYAQWIEDNTGERASQNLVLDKLNNIDNRLGNIEGLLRSGEKRSSSTSISELSQSEPFEGDDLSEVEADRASERMELNRSISGFKARIDSWSGLPNFSGSEVTDLLYNTCGGISNGPPPSSQWSRIAETLAVLQQLRSDLGTPIHLTSVYRSPSYNSCVGGVVGSWHSQNRAIDFYADAKTSSDWGYLLKSYRGRTFINPATGGSFIYRGGVGIYSNFVHVDTRGYDTDWWG